MIHLSKSCPKMARPLSFVTPKLLQMLQRILPDTNVCGIREDGIDPDGLIGFCHKNYEFFALE